MAFRIKPPVHLRKSKTATQKEILRRLDSFLKENSDEPAEILVRFWDDQRNAITYKELREAVQNGDLNQQQFEDWQKDYSVLVAEKFAPIWEKALAAGPTGQPLFDDRSFSFDSQAPGIVNWIQERGASFVTNSTDEQIQAIRSLLEQKIVEEHTVDELARFIRPCIGLTKGDTQSTLKLYDSVKEKLKTEHPRMKPESIRKKALDTAQKYAEQKHRVRAFLIAQTELEFAYNRGADQGIRQAQEAGLVGLTRKRWITSGDDAVCMVCAALDGTEIEMDDTFDFKGKVLFQGHKMLPPAHPRCACAVEYIEVEPPVLNQIGMDEPDRYEFPESGQGSFWPEAKSPDLSEEELASVIKWTSPDSYIFNEKMRNKGYDGLDESEKKMVDNLMSAMGKMPKPVATLNRSVWFPDDTMAQSWYSGYEPGKRFETGQIFSTTKNYIHDPEAQVQMYILNPKNGADMGAYGLKGENEVLYGPSAKFVVDRKSEFEGKYYIFLREAE